VTLSGVFFVVLQALNCIWGGPNVILSPCQGWITLRIYIFYISYELCFWLPSHLSRVNKLTGSTHMCNRDPNHSIPVKCTTIKGTKMKFTLEGPGEGVQIYLYSFFNLNARWGGWSMPHTSHFTSGHKTWYPSYRRVGGPQGQSGWVVKILPKPECTIITYSSLHTVQTERNYKCKEQHY